MNGEKSAPLDRLWSETPTGSPPVAEMIRNGHRLRRHRHRMTALTVAMVSALIMGGGAVAQQSMGTTARTPAVTPADTVAPHAKTEAVVYYLIDKPEHADGGFRPATQVTPRTVTVENTGDPAFEAIHTLLTAESPETGLSSGFNFLRGADNGTVDVNAVRHQDGVITIDLTRDPWDPYPFLDLCCPPDGETVIQQLVLTAQTALDTDDPVQFTANGDPVRGIWFHRLDGPVPGDPSIVLRPDDSDASDEGEPLSLPTSNWTPEDFARLAEITGELSLDENGCVYLANTRGGSRTYAIWPREHTATSTDAGVTLFDQNGRAVAHEGERFSVGGGYGKRPAFVDCIPDAVTEVWFVESEISAFQASD